MVVQLFIPLEMFFTKYRNPDHKFLKFEYLFIHMIKKEQNLIDLSVTYLYCTYWQYHKSDYCVSIRTENTVSSLQ